MPPTPGRGRVCATTLCAGTLPAIDLGLLYRNTFTRLQRFRYIAFASSSSISRIDRSIMAAAAMFCLGLRKYCTPLLLLAIWSHVFLAWGFSASRHLCSMLS
jgi:hypothetical protein